MMDVYLFATMWPMQSCCNITKGFDLWIIFLISNVARDSDQLNTECSEL